MRYVWFVSQLDENTLACTYAALILHDDGLPMSESNVKKLIEVSYFPSFFFLFLCLASFYSFRQARMYLMEWIVL
jgi:hypothetical protein